MNTIAGWGVTALKRRLPPSMNQPPGPSSDSHPYSPLRRLASAPWQGWHLEESPWRTYQLGADVQIELS